jgi:ADP-heptose:LPS heptosyltransferase
MILPLARRTPIGPFAAPRPSMIGPYMIRNPAKATAIGIMDRLLSLLPAKRGALPERLERVLIANWAHLGDVTTTIGLLRALQERYPGIRIGMLIGSWGRIAIERTGLVDDLHIVDHPMLNRADLSAIAKWKRYRETRRRAVKAMRAAGYQAAIDTYAFIPPAHPLFRAAGIPVRIGWTSGGFGPLLTHPVGWSDEERPMADQYRTLADRLDPARPFAPASFRPRRDRATLAPLPAELVGEEGYIVVHPGAGSPTRHWGTERWQATIARLRAAAGDRRIVLTGAGAADVAIAADLAGHFPEAIDMAGRADWESFVRILADAALVICPDTATGHVAALFAVPTVVIFTGTNSPAKWAPYNDRVRVLTRPVVCAPCNRAGCDAMACFLDVSPADVADAALAALAAPVDMAFGP